MNNKHLFLFSKGISHIGTKLFTFALSWYILSQTGSGLSFSISLLVNYLPQIILSLFAGNLSDRIIRPNRILVICDTASAIVCCIPLFRLSLASIYSTIFLLSAISAIFNNAIDTHLTHLDGIDSPETLKKLASSSQFITSGVNIAAPFAGGVLIQACPVQAFAVINAVSFLLSALGEIRLKYRPRQAQPAVSGAGTVQGTGNQNRKSALSYIFGQKKLRTFFIADSAGNFCFSAGINVALPLIVTTTLGISSGGYGLISSSIAIGSALCAVRRAKFPGDIQFQYPFLQLGLIGCCMLFLAATACLPCRDGWTVAALCADMFAVGWLSADINIKTKTALQIFVDSEYLGKVLGISTSLSFILIPLSLIAAGGMSEILPAFVLPLANGIGLIAVLCILRLNDQLL